MNMLHEIQPGDVVIVTVPTDKDEESRLDAMKTMLSPMILDASARCTILIGGETSVHVIRAKAESNPPNSDSWLAEKVGHLAESFRTLNAIIENEIKPRLANPNPPKTSDSWPAWRDVRVEKPPANESVLLWDDHHELVHLGVWKESLGIRYWMPLPEGPK